MREIPVFIASSVEEFAAERRKLSEFLEIINDVYRDTGAQLVWDRPENMSHEVRRGGSQISYDQKILKSRYFILLVGRNLGEFTRREYELALEQFVLTGAPKILPYFYAPEGDLPREVLAFRDCLRREQQYYTQTFTDFETLKRTIQLDLEKSGAFTPDAPEPDSVEDSLEQVQVKVRREIERLQREIKWTQNQKPSERLFVAVTRQYEDMVKLVRKSHVMPNALLDYMAYLFYQHMYDRAIELGHWLENVYRNEDPGEYKWNLLYNRLSMCYRGCNHHEQAEKYCREELTINRHMAAENPAYERDVALTCNNLGTLLSITNRMKEAEAYFREALEIRRRLAEANPAAYEPDVADICNNLAILLKDTNRMEEAETYYREALEICRRLAETNPSAHEPYVAQICNNLGILLKDTNHMEEAETYYREALEIRRRLAETNPAAYEPDMAGTCNNLANLLYSDNRKEEAEPYYREALEIRRRLAEANPAAYEPYVAQTCNNLGALMYSINRKEEAETYYRDAQKSYRRLAEANPAAYEPYVATTCNNMGNLLSDTDRKEEAEIYYQEALKIYCRLAEANPAAYEPYVSLIFFNLGLFEAERRKRKAARRYFKEALKLYEKYPHCADYAQRCRRQLAKL